MDLEGLLGTQSKHQFHFDVILALEDIRIHGRTFSHLVRNKQRDFPTLLASSLHTPEGYFTQVFAVQIEK